MSTPDNSAKPLKRKKARALAAASASLPTSQTATESKSPKKPSASVGQPIAPATSTKADDVEKKKRKRKRAQVTQDTTSVSEPPTAAAPSATEGESSKKRKRKRKSGETDTVPGQDAAKESKEDKAINENEKVVEGPSAAGSEGKRKRKRKGKGEGQSVPSVDTNAQGIQGAVVEERKEQPVVEAAPEAPADAPAKKKRRKSKAAEAVAEGSQQSSRPTPQATKTNPPEMSKDVTSTKKAKDSLADVKAAERQPAAEKSQPAVILTPAPPTQPVKKAAASAESKKPVSTSIQQTAPPAKSKKAPEPKFSSPAPEPSESYEDKAEGDTTDSDEDVHLYGFSTDDDDSSDDDMGEEWAGLDVTKLPTVAKDDAVVKKKLEKARRQPTEERGVIYLGRIPHGFYEDEMRSYFSQFGNVTRLRLSRNKKTGRSKHYAFIEFDSSSVAKIVAETMDNYLLMGHILTCKVIPKDEVHPELWIGANRKWRVVPRDRIARVQHNKPRTEEEQAKAEKRLLHRQTQRKRKLEEAGIKYDFDAVAYKKKAKATNV